MFLAAAERMGVAPADCIVFEDAPNGVEAARRAGMRAVAVLTMLIINTTLLGYAYAADRARRLVASPRTMRRINRITGGVMAGAAAAIAARG